MSTIQQHRAARDAANARILLSEDFDAFLNEVDRRIPVDVMKEVFEESRGKHGFRAFGSKMTRKWERFARRKKLPVQRALFHFLILCEALDYVPKTEN